MSILKRRLWLATHTGISTGLLMSAWAGRVVAATTEHCGKNGSTFLGLPTWYKYLNPKFVPSHVEGERTVPAECELLFNFPEDIGRVLLAIVEILLRVGGLIAVAFVIYGGFRYITSQGEPDSTANARKTIINAIIGVVITTIATAAVAFIGNALTKATP